jgi:hypothetical protein
VSIKGSLAFALLAVTSTLAQSPRPARVEFEVARAYQVRVSQVIGPEWLSSTLFDLDAKFPDGSNPAQVTEMLQALLTERFSLKQHREQKEAPVYALVVSKPPLRLKDSAPNPGASPRIEALVNITVATGAATSVDLGLGSSYTVGNGRRSPCRERKAPVDVLVVDNARRAPLEN